MNIEQARFNMIEQQIRPWNVLDTDVLTLLTIVKRENFLPEQQKNLAFFDTELALPDGGKMLTPKVEARIVQEVAVKKHEQVLVVGAGSGYLSALLAYHARHVTSVELSPAVYALAEQNLLREGVSNVTLELGNGALGWPAAAPYDVIVVTGSLPVLPDELQQQLKVGGRLFVIAGSAPSMTARLVTRSSEKEFTSSSLFDTNIAPLRDVAPVSHFSL